MHWYKKVSISLVIIMALTFGAGIVSAQEPPRQNTPLIGYEALVQVMADMTGQTRQALLDGVQPDTTLADLATANGLDSTTVVSSAAANLSERITQAVEDETITLERANQILSTLEADLTALMDQPLPQRQLAPLANVRQRAENILIETLSATTGQEPAELLAQARENSFTTLAQVAEANGASVEEIINAAYAAAVLEIDQAVADGQMSQEQADRLQAGLLDTYTNVMTHDFPRLGLPLAQIRERGEHLLIEALSAATNMSPEEMLAMARENDYTTMAEFAEANGVSVAAVVSTALTAATEEVNQAVAEGNMTQAQADRLLATLDTGFTNAMNRPLRALVAAQQNNPAANIRNAVVRSVSDATGLTTQEIAEQVRAGTTMADLLANNNVDAQSIVDAIVTELSDSLEQQIWRVLNAGSEPLPPETN